MIKSKTSHGNSTGYYRSVCILCILFLKSALDYSENTDTAGNSRFKKTFLLWSMNDYPHIPFSSVFVTKRVDEDSVKFVVT